MRLVSPSRLVVLMKQTFSASAEYKHMRSAGNSSSSLTTMTLPTRTSVQAMSVRLPAERSRDGSRARVSVSRRKAIKAANVPWRAPAEEVKDRETDVGPPRPPPSYCAGSCLLLRGGAELPR